MRPIWHFLVVAGLVTSVTCGSEPQQAKGPRLEDFLKEVGRTYNLFFTVEGAYSGRIRIDDPLLNQSIAVSAVATNLQSVIFTITNSIANLVVIADTHTSNVYHLVEIALVGMPGYTMNQIVQSVEFKGNAAAFVRRLSETFPNLSNREGAVLGAGPVFLNEGTATSINEERITLRDALTDGVNLLGYSRLVWTSMTSLETGQIQVSYKGPRPR
jgi:hypothetical protein